MGAPAVVVLQAAGAASVRPALDAPTGTITPRTQCSPSWRQYLTKPGPLISVMPRALRSARRTPMTLSLSSSEQPIPRGSRASSTLTTPLGAKTGGFTSGVSRRLGAFGFSALTLLLDSVPPSSEKAPAASRPARNTPVVKTSRRLMITRQCTEGSCYIPHIVYRRGLDHHVDEMHTTYMFLKKRKRTERCYSVSIAICVSDMIFESKHRGPLTYSRTELNRDLPPHPPPRFC